MPITPRTAQAARSSAMRSRLIAAAKESLYEHGYGRTTAVEVCARAGVTRGALFHHFRSLSDLLGVTLDGLCSAMIERGATIGQDAGTDPTWATLIDSAWSNFGDPEFKIVIELWLAARNDPELREELEPVITKFSLLVAPDSNADIARIVGNAAEARGFYRLVIESMIGMALGRALSPDGAAIGHEKAVVASLKQAAEKLALANPRPAINPSARRSRRIAKARSTAGRGWKNPR
jgi:AcrR family transcriptional regulator